MKTKFSQFERVAGLFVLVAIGGFFVAGMTIGIRRGWFEAKAVYRAKFTSGDGLFPGMPVQISGLRAGAVDDVELYADNQVVIEFHVLERFANKMRKDSVLRTIRPFLIGDKVIDISTGNMESEIISEGEFVTVESTVDLMDMIGGRHMTSALQSLTAITENMKIVMEAFGDQSRTKAFIQMFDNLSPLLSDARVLSKELIQMSQGLNNKKGLEKTIANAAILTEELKLMAPQIRSFHEEAPEIGRDLGRMVSQLTQLTESLAKVLPDLIKIAPELPKATQTAVVAMNEAVIVLKAMQKSFLLKGAVEDVKEDEKKEKERQLKMERIPADER
ncbi:MAG: MlaD family protein [Bdellovibrionales bacterium]|nr:MlaD family protein [Bdellovibrionales bacterium]